MSEIVGFIGVSHSPFATLLPPTSPLGPGARFLRDVERAAEAVKQLAPDIVVLVGPDHFHGAFYDQMSPFVIGVEQATGFGDYGSRAGDIPVASPLAWSVRDGVTEAGFDVALSYSLTIDHGLVQAYDMVLGQSDVPIVPVVVNTIAPPLPSLARCRAFGRALGDAVRSDGASHRVLVLASGGLSHWLPSNDPRDTGMDVSRRHSLIHGRADVRAFAAAREPGVRALGGKPDARVNEEWDRGFLRDLSHAGPPDLTDEAELERHAGNGGNEVRTWLLGSAAADAHLRWTAYEPVPEWITGMGIGATFSVDA